MKGFKKLTWVILAVMLLNSFSLPAIAKGGIDVFVNGEKIEFDVPPQTINYRTMVPVRAIFEALGADVRWEELTQTVTATRKNSIVQLSVGLSNMFVDGKTYIIDAPACIIDDRVLVPARTVAEAFGAEVVWDDEANAVLITTNTSDFNADGSCYPNTSIPDYETFTGLPLIEAEKDSGSQVRIFKYNNDKTKASQYIVNLVKEGWSLYDEEKDDESLTMYFKKDEEFFAVSYLARFQEVWILII